jgi:hypothetical protein
MPASDRRNIEKTALIERRAVTAGGTVLQGQPVVLAAAGTVAPAGAVTDPIYGIAYLPGNATGTWPCVAGENVEVVLLGSPCIVPCRVGTAAALTRGLFCQVDPAFDGVTNMTAGVAAVRTCIGMAVQTGSVAGELMGVNLGIRPSTSA